MARVPVLGGALRGISVRALTRVLEDMNVALDKVRHETEGELWTGERFSVDHAICVRLRPLCRG